MDRLIKKISHASEVKPALVADEIDKLIHRIVRKLKQGQVARVPGLGSFEPGRETLFRMEAADAARRAKAGRNSGQDR